MLIKIKVLVLFGGVWMGGILNIVIKNKVYCLYIN